MNLEVFHSAGQGVVVIAQKGSGPTDPGFESVGTFKMPVDEENMITDSSNLGSARGDHRFVAKARELLEKKGVTNLDRLTFKDQASNAPIHGEGLHTDDLPESEPGTHPDASSQKGGEVSAVGTDPASLAPNGKTEK